MSPAGSVPIAPALRTAAPSFASVTAVPPAEPAGPILISSTSWPHGPPEQEHLVMHAGELVQHARKRRRHRRVRMDDGAGLVAPVDTEVEAELGARLELAFHEAPLEVDDADLLGSQALELSPARRDRHQRLMADAQVAGRPEHEPLAREAAAGGG